MKEKKTPCCTPGTQGSAYESADSENVKQDVEELNSLGQFDSDDPSPMPPHQ